MSIFVHSALSEGSQSIPVRIETTFMRGMSGLHLVGHTTEVCRTGIERAKASLEKVGLTLPHKKIVISISPAETRKDGSQFDLAFAVSLVLLLSEQPTSISADRWMFVSELSLDGSLRGVKNIISYTLTALEMGCEGLIVAQESLQEAMAIHHLHKTPSQAALKILAFQNLGEVISWLYGHTTFQGLTSTVKPCEAKPLGSDSPNFDDMVLTSNLREVGLAVAVGHHSLLLYGPPGTGKSMFSSRLPSLFNNMDPKTHLECLKIHSSLEAKLPLSILKGQPPFKSPHHQASAPAVIGTPERPGEISLAHGGILFLDELPEFRRDIIEALREPLETGYVRVSRAKQKVEWGARAIVIGACNPCPCGWFGSLSKMCACPINKIQAYRRKLSGPILDRIDIHINMPEDLDPGASFKLLKGHQKSEISSTEGLRQHVVEASKFAYERNKKFGIYYNCELKTKDLISALGCTESILEKMIAKVIPVKLSNRSLVRTLRVSRTLADLDLRGEISEKDLKKALKWQHEEAAKERGDHAHGLS